MLIKKEDRKQKQIAKDSVVWEYPLDNKNMGIASAKINGRFPDSGRTINKMCQEVYFVIVGLGTIFIEDEKFELKKGDALLIGAGKRYYVVGKKLKLVCPTSPSWYPEQCTIVDN